MGRFSIILVVGFAIIAGGLKLNHSRLCRDAQDISNEKYLEAAARNTTNSVINLCMEQLGQNFGWKDGFSNVNMGCGSGSAIVEDATDDPSIEWNQVRITATGTYGGESQTAVVTVRQTPFSEFAYFTDSEPPIYFVTGDTMRGPIHTNGKFHIWGDPVFFGLVSSKGNFWVGTGNPEFKAGTNFGCEEIPLPVDMSIIQGKAQNGGVLFGGDTNIEFLSDGTLNWEVFHDDHHSPVVDSSGNIDIGTINGVLATIDDHDFYIKGTLNGRVTLLSDGDIWIEDDLLYASDPLTDPNSDDILGLIAMKDVIVADNVANRNDCQIYATIMALDKSFKVENHGSGSPRGTLTLVGGLIQKMRGPVGTAWWNGSIKSGFQKHYTYDMRFQTKAPPFYPILRRTSIVSWYE